MLNLKKFIESWTVKKVKQGQLANDATSSVYDYYLQSFLNVYYWLE